LYERAVASGRRYPSPEKSLILGGERVYAPEAADLAIFTFGNGVPMSLRAAREIEKRHGWKVRVIDLRWLLPLNVEAIGRHAAACKRLLVVDEGRRSAGVGEGIITATSRQGTAPSLCVASLAWTPSRRWPEPPCWCCLPRQILSLWPLTSPDSVQLSWRPTLPPVSYT
jgi:deoxyxylulose-5-phosphate synthase